MRIGVFYFPADYGINIAELAQALEERGFESLFVPEHTHIPTSRKSPFPSGGELPKRYAHTHDSFVALSFAAAASRKLLLGTGICLIPERDPIVTAKCVASLDQLSGGRFVFGIGGGWNVEEMENHGARYNTRFKLMRERILAMKALWTEEEAEFHGEMVDFDKVWSWPKPAQKPHPPIILGGETDYTLRRVVEYCDGWFPRPGRGYEIKQQLDRLHHMAEEKGRDPKTLSTSVFRAPPDRAALKEYEAAGIDRAVLEIPDERRDPAGARPLHAAARLRSVIIASRRNGGVAISVGRQSSARDCVAALAMTSFSPTSKRGDDRCGSAFSTTTRALPSTWPTGRRSGAAASRSRSSATPLPIRTLRSEHWPIPRSLQRCASAPRFRRASLIACQS